MKHPVSSKIEDTAGSPDFERIRADFACRAVESSVWLPSGRRMIRDFGLKIAVCRKGEHQYFEWVMRENGEVAHAHCEVLPSRPPIL